MLLCLQESCPLAKPGKASEAEYGKHFGVTAGAIISYSWDPHVWAMNDIEVTAQEQ